MADEIRKWLRTKKFIIDEVRGIDYPSKETIIEIHDYLIESFLSKGEVVYPGILSDAPLELEGIKWYLNQKKDRIEDIIHRGAQIFNLFLQAGHPFVDGNKRTGFTTLWLFLMLNGLHLKVSSFHYRRHLKKINMWAMTTDKDNIPQIVDWIKHNLKED